jgi:GNAT superfamily N-acetyltransferase
VIVIRRITAQEPSVLGGLCELLTDTVSAGGSVGFLAPLPAATAQQYWQKVLQATAGALVLWVAEQDGKVIGSIQLALCEKENAPHRADVQKLFVLSAYRGHGVASRLMNEMERFARTAGRTLLVLDTEAGSLAESIYRHFGWQRAGEIPGFALTPGGKLHATVYYFKSLAP